MLCGAHKTLTKKLLGTSDIGEASLQTVLPGELSGDGSFDYYHFMHPQMTSDTECFWADKVFDRIW